MLTIFHPSNISFIWWSVSLDETVNLFLVNWIFHLTWNTVSNCRYQSNCLKSFIFYDHKRRLSLIKNFVCINIDTKWFIHNHAFTASTRIQGELLKRKNVSEKTRRKLRKELNSRTLLAIIWKIIYVCVCALVYA